MAQNISTLTSSGHHCKNPRGFLTVASVHEILRCFSQCYKENHNFYHDMHSTTNVARLLAVQWLEQEPFNSENVVSILSSSRSQLPKVSCGERLCLQHEEIEKPASLNCRSSGRIRTHAFAMAIQYSDPTLSYGRTELLGINLIEEKELAKATVIIHILIPKMKLSSLWIEKKVV